MLKQKKQKSKKANKTLLKKRDSKDGYNYI